MHIQDLEKLIKNFIQKEFVFIRVDLYKLLTGESLILWTNKEFANLSEIDFNKDCAYLLERDFFRRWREYSKSTITEIADEFYFLNILLVSKIRKGVIKQIVKSVVDNSGIIQPISSNQSTVVATSERKIVKKINPLPSHKRKPATLISGGLGYICINNTRPFIANPCFVLEANNDTARVMYFTNHVNGKESKNKDSNAYGFLSVCTEEIGRTPEEAVENMYI